MVALQSVVGGRGRFARELVGLARREVAGCPTFAADLAERDAARASATRHRYRAAVDRESAVPYIQYTTAEAVAGAHPLAEGAGEGRRVVAGGIGAHRVGGITADALIPLIGQRGLTGNDD